MYLYKLYLHIELALYTVVVSLIILRYENKCYEEAPVRNIDIIIYKYL